MVTSGILIITGSPGSYPATSFVTGRNYAFKYRKRERVEFPPFAEFSAFIRNISDMKNDPNVQLTTPAPRHHGSGASDQGRQSKGTGKSHPANVRGPDFSARTLKTNSSQSPADKSSACIVHGTSGHGLDSCHVFARKPFAVKREILRKGGLCYRCCKG